MHADYICRLIQYLIFQLGTDFVLHRKLDYAIATRYDGPILYGHIKPHQPHPYEKSSTLWKQAIKLAFPQDVSKQFLNPVGRWTDGQSRTICTCFFHRHSAAVYRGFGNEWKKYIRRTTTRGQLGQFPRLIYECDSLGLPPDSVPATVELKNGIFTLTSWAPEIDQPLMATSLTDWYTLSIQRAIINMQTDSICINCTEIDIVDYINRGEINLVSDGYYQKEVLYSFWQRLGLSPSIDKVIKLEDTMLQATQKINVLTEGNCWAY